MYFAVDELGGEMDFLFAVERHFGQKISVDEKDLFATFAELEVIAPSILAEKGSNTPFHVSHPIIYK